MSKDKTPRSQDKTAPVTAKTSDLHVQSQGASDATRVLSSLARGANDATGSLISQEGEVNDVFDRREQGGFKDYSTLSEPDRAVLSQYLAFAIAGSTPFTGIFASLKILAFMARLASTLEARTPPFTMVANQPPRGEVLP
jgi:hypothetical protein